MDLSHRYDSRFKQSTQHSAISTQPVEISVGLREIAQGLIPES